MKHWPLLSLPALMAACLITLPLSLLAGEKIIAVTEEYPPYNYTEQGKLQGYSVQLAKELLKRGHLDYQMQAYPWARAYQMAQTQPNVLIFSIVRQPERESQFQWIGTIAKREAYLYKLAARKDIRVNTIEDVKRYKVGVNKADITEDTLRQHGFEVGKNIDISPQDKSNINKLLLGRIDFIIGTELSMAYLCRQAGVSPDKLERSILLADHGDYYLAMSLQTPASVVNTLRAELTTMKKNGELKRIASQYLSAR
ncbi:transporter substrate-binding domain-containing protein [Undibacterium sp. CY18W]|uniref:Transporter substrate-binding domain-containing protein n=1 Tax=Undibacterium hunanense TaxID=2762292 RepID=A0ABR6ZX24_9BURK|nr:transporter substrate-binding domain-containing protein [Undibacterium hunanense]MBC3920411.1 transporter substrate-binding domain-containing protein [Undibacterium hunanense]